MLTQAVGSSGPAVVHIQQALVDAGAQLVVDGQFNGPTEAAVRAAQVANGLTVDGVVGNDTILALGLDWASIDAEGFRGECARLAEAEWRRWHSGNTRLVETDPAMSGVLRAYYRTGVNQQVADAELQSPVWHQTNFWSAVFVSWVIRTAGGGSKWTYSASHQRYIATAKVNRESSNVNNPFWAFQIEEIELEVGDVVCKSRDGSGATYENIDSGPRPCHSDVVVDVRPTTVLVTGGNVSQSVEHKELTTTTSGTIDTTIPKQASYFAAIRTMEFG